MKAFDRIDRPVVIFCKAVVFITFIVILRRPRCKYFTGLFWISHSLGQTSSAGTAWYG